MCANLDVSTTCILEQQNLSPLTVWPSWTGILWKWASMLTKLAGMVYAGWLYSMQQKILFQMKFTIFQGCPTKPPTYLGSLLHIISSLFSHFRSWDYPEHFGIYSQLNRKSKTWLFISPKVFFLHRTGENPNLTAFTSKIQIFLKPEWNKSRPHENEFWQFSNAKMRFLKN